jgi:hypothetical protein
MSARRKNYCPRCRTRVGRAAKKCGYCGHLLLNGARLAVGALTGLILLFLLERFMNFL